MKILISGGGTAGHINPALAAAEHLKKNYGAKLLFIGTESGLESSLVPKAGFDIKYIEVAGLIRKITVKNAAVFYKYIKSIARCKRIISEFAPDAVIGTGGYVCAPVIRAAASLGVPTLVHEQNVIPGVTVKLCAKSCNILAISFSETLDYLKSSVRKKCVLTGNPLREGLLAAECGADKDGRPLVVIFGGSLGARAITEAACELVLNKDLSGIRLIFGTGKRYYDEVCEKTAGACLGDNIKIVPYIDNMEQVMPEAQLVVSRAGALTVSELCALGIPSVLIPSPYVAHNHQEFNARALEAAGAAALLKEGELSGESLYKEIFTILRNPGRRRKMSESAKRVGITDGTKRICELAARLAGEAR